MRILGIDPGVNNIGLCLYDTHDYTKIKTYVWEFKSYCKTLMQLSAIMYDQQAIAIEKPFFTAATLPNNVKTLEFIGLTKLAAERNDLLDKIYEYSPATIKKEFTGNGKATKKDIIKEVKRKFNLEPKATHDADAIAIAYTHYVKCPNLYR